MQFIVTISNVETHLDGDIDVDKLNLNGYCFINSNHPQNRKRGGVGFYIRESFTCRTDLGKLRPAGHIRPFVRSCPARTRNRAIICLFLLLL